MKRISLIIFISWLSFGLNAQPDTRFTQHLFNPAFVNPAASGSFDALNALAVFRSQWTGLQGHPVSQFLGADLPVYQAGGGAGLYLYNDQAGQERNTHLRIQYSYNLPFAGKRLSAGISGGFFQKSLDGSKLRAPDGIYSETGIINHNDNLLPVVRVSSGSFDLGLGFFYREENITAGIAVNHLTEPSVSYTLPSGSMSLKLKRQYSLTGSYRFTLGSGRKVQPMALFSTDLVKSQVDVGALFWVTDNIWTGLAFRGFSNRTADALSGMAGMWLSRQVRLGYSYDLSLSRLNGANAGSHEVFLNYQLAMEREGKGKIIHNPRFLPF